MWSRSRRCEPQWGPVHACKKTQANYLQKIVALLTPACSRLALRKSSVSRSSAFDERPSNVDILLHHHQPLAPTEV